MDKAYTMMYELDKHGLVATTSSLSQTDSAEAIERSLYLPKSNTSLLIDVDSKFRYIDINQGILEDAQINPNEKILPNDLLGTTFERVLDKYVPVLIQDGNLVKVTTIEQLDQWLPTTDGRTRASFYIDFLNALNEYSEGKKLVWVNTYNIDLNNLPAGFDGISATKEAIITWVQVMSKIPNIPKLVLDLNRHNEKSSRSREMQAGLRNRVMAGMRLIATDIHNLESATQPMDMAPVTSVIDIYESKYKPEIAGRKYDYISPVTKWLIQYENAVGKEDVGIAANAIKADGAIQQRYNMLFANTSAEEAKNLAINLDLDLAYGDRRIFSKHFVKWANVKCTKEQFVTMLQEADLQNDYEYQILSGNKNYDQRIIDEVMSDWNLFRKLNPDVTLEDNYIDFLWFRTNFENNAADYLSIFISMATD